MEKIEVPTGLDLALGLNQETAYKFFCAKCGKDLHPVCKCKCPERRPDGKWVYNR